VIKKAGQAAVPTAIVTGELWTFSAVVQNQRYHAAIALLFSALFLMFILLFGLRLGAL